MSGQLPVLLMGPKGYPMPADDTDDGDFPGMMVFATEADAQAWIRAPRREGERMPRFRARQLCWTTKLVLIEPPEPEDDDGS